MGAPAGLHGARVLRPRVAGETSNFLRSLPDAMFITASSIRTSMRATKGVPRGAASAASTPVAKRASAPTVAKIAKKARQLAPADLPAPAMPVAAAMSDLAAEAARVVTSSGATVTLEPGYTIINIGGEQKIVRVADVVDLTNSHSEDEREDAAYDRALAPAAAAEPINAIKTEAEIVRLANGVVPGHDFDIGDFDFSELERVELAAPIAVAPIAAAPVAAAPLDVAAVLVAAAPGPILFADGDDIVQQALAEAAAAPVKPMSVRQRELLKKFNISTATLDKITSSAQASAVIDGIMSARNRHGALAAAAQ